MGNNNSSSTFPDGTTKREPSRRHHLWESRPENYDTSSGTVFGTGRTALTNEELVGQELGVNPAIVPRGFDLEYHRKINPDDRSIISHILGAEHVKPRHDRVTGILIVTIIAIIIIVQAYSKLLIVVSSIAVVTAGYAMACYHGNSVSLLTTIYLIYIANLLLLSNADGIGYGSDVVLGTISVLWLFILYWITRSAMLLLPTFLTLFWLLGAMQDYNVGIPIRTDANDDLVPNPGGNVV